MKKLLLLSALLCTFDATTAHAGLTTKSLEALKKYCIPKPGDNYDGVEVCGSEFEGKYDKNKSCTCADSRYLKWDDEYRHCIIKCPAGTHPKRVIPQETTKCPAGMHAKTYSENIAACPAYGYKVYSIINK